MVAPDFLPKTKPDTEGEVSGYPPELTPDYERKRAAIDRALEHFETPFYLYDERGIRQTTRQINHAFEWAQPGFRQHYAVKACPNPVIVEALRAEGSGADCSSLPELNLADGVGMCGEEIMFTSNNTPPEEFQRATELGAIINFDDLTQIEVYLDLYGQSPEIGCVRFNPGELKEGNEIIGRPEEAKFGMRRDQLSRAYHLLRENGATRFGLHTMVVSNERHEPYFAETAELLFKTIRELEEEGIRFEFVNLGGGFGIPYRPEDEPLDLEKASSLIRREYIATFGDERSGPRILTEMGRYPTGPHGVLVSRVRYMMEKYRRIAGVDGTMADLIRPGMYGAYHHISVHGKEGWPVTETYDVVGSLCENNDKFAIQRKLPKLEVGDVLVIHDAGAHARAMGFNYNGKLRAGEILLREDGTLEMIRRPETEEDYFTTLDLSAYEGEVVITPSRS